MMYAEELWYQENKNAVPAFSDFWDQKSKNPAIFNALEVFHDFILAHDDIVDQDAMRWGNPTIHTRLQTAYPDITIRDREHFWKSLAMIWWDVLHAMAQSYIFDADLDDSRKLLLLRTMNEAMLDVARGWYKQFLSDSMQISEVSLEYILEYNLWQVTGCYTFLFPLRFGMVLARGTMQIDPAMLELCRYVGILFQTGDDVIGLYSDPATSGKSNYGDITQGKKTIPLHFAYISATSEQKSCLDALIGKHDITAEEVKLVKSIITEHGLVPTKQFLSEYAEKAYISIEQLDANDIYKQWWREFVGYLITREL
jgi:geranylgeranyl pyrophosphate synthase